MQTRTISADRVYMVCTNLQSKQIFLTLDFDNHLRLRTHLPPASLAIFLDNLENDCFNHMITKMVN